MKNPPSISDAEWEVMRVIWDCSPITAGDVVEALSPHKEWSPRTVKTMLNRLVNKGALSFEARGKHYLYRPAVAREECVRSESRSFLERVFGGSVAPMLNHFVQNASLTPEEIAELKRILSEQAATPPKKPGRKGRGGE